MAIEVRSFEFEQSFESPDYLIARTIEVPDDRSYRLGAVYYGGRVVLLVEGDWSATTSVNIRWLRAQELPWEPQPGETAVTSICTDAAGYNMIAIETA